MHVNSHISNDILICSVTHIHFEFIQNSYVSIHVRPFKRPVTIIIHESPRPFGPGGGGKKILLKSSAIFCSEK